jgi:hypothetical protein
LPHSTLVDKATHPGKQLLLDRSRVMLKVLRVLEGFIETTFIQALRAPSIQGMKTLDADGTTLSNSWCYPNGQLQMAKILRQKGEYLSFLEQLSLIVAEPPAVLRTWRILKESVRSSLRRSDTDDR